MKKFRYFRLGRKLVRVFKWIIRPRRKKTRYHSSDHRTRQNPISKICDFAQYMRRLCCCNSDSGYIRLGQHHDPVPAVPKGHLVVYIGQLGGEPKRVVVPVMYFNHPLFVDLLKEAERVYGFNQPGGITIPCEISEFERVRTRIASWHHYRRRKSKWRLIPMSCQQT
ncbi:hypothetical protein HS088_TW16G00869 [Tripterygium wilfordii]|uniref:Uncharacterized protein n=1 Tax=Tripterygium wilfordii TaxID=458696 RepID=A0A7J7CK39_TRIWF|nr:auxin-responsive protein SAUR36-like [Tripterygium wilfordii]KAF5734420.1 hypothetical protein HS088_TW16G00869 [Tripterygium wilfordii]